MTDFLFECGNGAEGDSPMRLELRGQLLARSCQPDTAFATISHGMTRHEPSGLHQTYRLADGPLRKMRARCDVSDRLCTGAHGAQHWRIARAAEENNFTVTVVRAVI